MKKNIYITLIILFSSISCKQISQEKIVEGTTSIITGKIEDYNKYPNTKIVNLQKGFIGTKQTRLEGKINKDGSFKIKFKQLTSEDFHLKPFNNIYLYINPGDSIHVNINLADGIKFEGDSKEYNELLNAFYQKGYFAEELGEDIQTLSTLSADEYIQYREDILSNELSSLNKFSEEKSIPDSLRESLKSQIINKKYSRLIEYGLSNCSFINEPKAKEIEIAESYKYFKEIKEKLNKDISNTIDHSSASELLNLYSLYFFQKVLNLNRKAIINRPDRNFLIINGIIENEENLIIRENLLHNHAKFMLESNEVDEYRVFEKQFNTHIKSKHLKDELAIKYSSLNKNGIDISPLENYSLKDDEFLKSIISKHKGKVIYMDFWATWCKPCIIDILESKEIIEKDYQSNDIQFLYLCTGTSEDACNKVMKENNIAGIHLTLEGADSHKIMRRFNNSALPFQVLVNKEGEIVRKGNAIRLSSPITKNLINELLKK